jgi:hypothetical protein
MSSWIQYNKARYNIQLNNKNSNELLINNESVIFVILRNINTLDNTLWKNCYDSIRNFYTNQIIIIDDNSKYKSKSDDNLINTEIIYSEYPGAGELLPYYYYYKYKWANNMIFMHDSMFLIREFTSKEIEKSNVMLWDFLDRTYDDNNKINDYIELLDNNNILHKVFNSNEWKGCFGVSTIISIDFLINIENKYGFCSRLIDNVKTRDNRICIERILGIIFYAENILYESLFGDINKDYPFSFNNFSIDRSINILKNYKYNTAICKMWRGR